MIEIKINKEIQICKNCKTEKKCRCNPEHKCLCFFPSCECGNFESSQKLSKKYCGRFYSTEDGDISFHCGSEVLGITMACPDCKTSQSKTSTEEKK